MGHSFTSNDEPPQQSIHFARIAFTGVNISILYHSFFPHATIFYFPALLESLPSLRCPSKYSRLKKWGGGIPQIKFYKVVPFLGPPKSPVSLASLTLQAQNRFIRFRGFLFVRSLFVCIFLGPRKSRSLSWFAPDSILF